MLLLYPVFLTPVAVWSDIYIPLCFYFICVLAYPVFLFAQIYIPLCFYFILPLLRHSALRSAFTFHYASTLSHYFKKLPYHRGRIYIPLCFYFIRWKHTVKGAGKFIYIPLCFYFIEVLPGIPGWRIRIYIPLCFYFIRFWMNMISSKSTIYIPLCFYFIRLRRDTKFLRGKFTFHYASTLSGWGGNLDFNIF